MTTQQMLREADQIKASLASGKITGKAKIKAAKYRMYNLRYRAGQKDKKRRENVNPAQVFLPNFLKQMKTVGIEELLSEKASRVLRQQIGQAATKAAVMAFKKAK